MIERIKQTLRQWLSIVELEKKLQRHQDFVTAKVSELKEYTRVDADMGIRGNNTIILTGVYRNKAYVRFYDIGDGEFQKLIEQMKHMQDHCLIRNVDQPPHIRGMFEI